jgi:DNA-binding NarL/FixJ family response regulator
MPPTTQKKHRTADKKKTKTSPAEDNLLQQGPRVCPHCGNIVPALTQRVPRAKPEELTDQQTKVLRMVAMGHTAQQIGDAIGISRRTVEFHRGAIMNKLGLRTTSELTMYAIAHSLVHL